MRQSAGRACHCKWEWFEGGPPRAGLRWDFGRRAGDAEGSNGKTCLQIGELAKWWQLFVEVGGEGGVGTRTGTQWRRC